MKYRVHIKHSRNSVNNYNFHYLNLRTSCSCPDLHHKRSGVLAPFSLPKVEQGKMREGRSKLLNGEGGVAGQR